MLHRLSIQLVRKGREWVLTVTSKAWNVNDEAAQTHTECRVTHNYHAEHIIVQTVTLAAAALQVNVK
jgi:hypothetical protein